MTSSPSLADRAARAALTFLAEPADPVVSALLAAASPARVLEMLTTGNVIDLGDPGMAAAARGTIDHCRRRLSEIPGPGQLEAWQDAGIRLICPGDPEWPGQLDDLGSKAPYALWARGHADLRFSCLRSVSITGSRAATAYGAYVARDMAAHIAAHGWTVVSGAAYGVDAAAHSAALRADGTTIAVLPCGVDVPCPAGHRDLLDEVARQGLVISDYPPGTKPSRLRFLTRNRIIAALSAGTLVIEAGEHSGALNTARHALGLCRVLMAVPGPVTSEQSRGCHTIIRDWGGTLISRPGDVFEEVTVLPGRAPEGRVPVPGEARPGQIGMEAAAVLDALPARGGLGTAAVAASAGLPPITTLRLLRELAARGLAERDERGWRARRS